MQEQLQGNLEYVVTDTIFNRNLVRVKKIHSIQTQVAGSQICPIFMKAISRTLSIHELQSLKLQNK